MRSTYRYVGPKKIAERRPFHTSLESRSFRRTTCVDGFAKQAKNWTPRETSRPLSSSMNQAGSASRTAGANMSPVQVANPCGLRAK